MYHTTRAVRGGMDEAQSEFLHDIGVDEAIALISLHLTLLSATRDMVVRFDS